MKNISFVFFFAFATQHANLYRDIIFTVSISPSHHHHHHRARRRPSFALAAATKKKNSKLFHFHWLQIFSSPFGCRASAIISTSTSTLYKTITQLRQYFAFASSTRALNYIQIILFRVAILQKGTFNLFIFFYNVYDLLIEC